MKMEKKERELKTYRKTNTSGVQVTYAPLVGTYIRRWDKHGRRKRKIALERRKSFVLKKCILVLTAKMQYHGNILT
jgi:hypothetical protein